MAVLDNARHEEFALNVAMGKKLVDSYRLAFSKNGNNDVQLASNLYNKKDDNGILILQKRVKEIRQEMLERLNIDEFFAFNGVLKHLNNLDKISVDYAVETKEQINASSIAIKYYMEIIKYLREEKTKIIEENEEMFSEEKIDEMINVLTMNMNDSKKKAEKSGVKKNGK